jgi:propionate CoA-transferase
MGLRDDVLRVPLEQRFSYDAQQNVFFINFEGLSLRSTRDVNAIKRAVHERLAPLGHKVYAIVNYDNFSIAPEVMESYAAMVKALVARFYSGVTRYTTSTFMRMKLGEALRDRAAAPYVFESAEEALAQLRRLEDGPVDGNAAE